MVGGCYVTAPRLNGSRFSLQHSYVFVLEDLEERAAPDSALDSALDSTPGSGSPGAHHRADHHVPHSRGFVLLVIIKPTSQIYSGNVGAIWHKPDVFVFYYGDKPNQ